MTRTLTAWLLAVPVIHDAGVKAQTAKQDPPTHEVSTVPNPSSSRKTNRLSKATSPYLLQHQHNPVDWHEWGDEAFSKAAKEDKPIFLSIGYSTCHWCHVMAHESFEDEEVARALNQHFVSIKVDREERPDIDELYMAYTQALTGHGGWPMSVWLTPERAPFHAGTYFPKAQFLNLLGGLADTWENKRDQITQSAGQAKSFFTDWASGPAPAEGVIERGVIDQTARQLARHFDRTHGGLGSGTNKFPPAMAMELLLRVYHRTGDGDLFAAVDITLDHMARGGIYDHVGGGICRYSTDPEWLVPHFEKMLYDQAMVSAIYLDAWQVSKKPSYARVAADIFEYVVEDFQSPQGGFYSARDADSEGFEGAYYIWTVEQVQDVLGDEADLFCKFYDVTESGNWFERFGHAPPGPKNILHISKPPAAFAKLHGLDATDLTRRIESWREKMKVARSKRIPPHLDDKVLTAWNGLMIAALAKGGRALDEPKFTESAARAADFLLKNLRKDGRLLRSWRNGEARLTGFLDDYAFFAEGLLNLYEATFDRKWLDEALSLSEQCIKHYYDDKAGGFFFTAVDAEALLARSKNPHDGAIPSGNSVMALDLLRLAGYFNRADLREKAEGIFRAFAAEVERSPGAFERLLCAADFHGDRVAEIVVIGDPKLPATRELLRTVYDRYFPNKLVTSAAETQGEDTIPLLARRALMNGRPTAYVCENYRCKLPVTSAVDLARLLDEPRDPGRGASTNH